MRFKGILFVLFFVGCLIPVFAQDSGINAIAFNGFSFSFDSSLATNVNIVQFAGNPTDLQQPGGPEVKHTQYILYNEAPAPESIFDARVAIRVYRTADFAGYPDYEEQFGQLNSLLSSRPDLSQFLIATEDANANTLPFLPVIPAAQVIRARAQYVETSSLVGILYLTAFRQDVAPFVNTDFTYTFQGVSVDGQFYVSAIMRPTTDRFPAELPGNTIPEDFANQLMEYLNESIAQLSQAAPENFTPSLTVLDTLVQSFTFVTAGTATPVAPEPTDNQDASMGGLAGVTWSLVSYGSPDAPQPVLPNAPITLTFSEQGIAGSTGCNQFTGTFAFENNTIQISDIISTLVACEADIATQEAAYLNALQTANTFQISNGQLQITYADGVLTFVAGPQSS
jgi:heat shock protein HslJ